MRVTMAEVGRRAGVSTSTVSRALNGNPSVAPELQKRVLAAVRELDYRRNGPARTLRRQRAEMIGILVSDIENPHFSEMVHTAEAAAYRHGFRVLLCNTDESVEKQEAYLQVMADECTVGAIVTPCDPHDPEIGRLMDFGTEVVALDRAVADPRADAVVANNEGGARMAVGHLVTAGYQRIGLIALAPDIETGAGRLNGYVAAMEAANLSPHWEDGGLRIASGRQATERLLSAHPDTEALVLGNNLVAVGAIEALRTLGRRVPDDIAVVSFDDPLWATLVQPTLTTVAQPMREMATAAIELLLERVTSGRSERRELVFDLELRVRESSRRGSDAQASRHASGEA